MALLGHVARLVVHPADIDQVLPMFDAVGFDAGDETSYGRRLSDGQILMLLNADGPTEPGLLYAAPSLQSVGDRLAAAGIAFTGNRTSELHLEGPGQLRIRIVAATADDIEERSGLDNPVLGFLDSIVVPVSDTALAARWAQSCGFFILETSDVAAPMVDVTDGLVKISFRQQQLRAPYLHYTADIDKEWADDLKQTLGQACTIIPSGTDVGLVSVDLAGALHVMITSDDF
ncbi:MAG: hypothetical protein FGM33_00660 [Candidatus Kapabacteria bacterium]|nr:hypothetical protein [Candidatus Kapabacteria bacterium]